MLRNFINILSDDVIGTTSASILVGSIILIYLSLSGIKSSIYRYIPFAGINEFHAKHHKFHNVHFASVFSFWDVIFKTHSNSKNKEP